MSTPVETSTTFEIPDAHTHGRASFERTARRTTWASEPATESELLLEREWLATNGLGGYASGTISGACTRRYHGLLIAALPAPLGRMVMFNHLAEELKLIDRSVLRLDWDEPLSIDEARLDQRFGIVAGASGEFTMESGLPVWRYKHGPYQIEKRVVLPHLQNTVLISYKVLAAPEPMRLRLRPTFHFRAHEAAVSGGFASPYTVAALEQRDTPKSYFHEVIEEYKERRDVLVQELHKIEGVTVAVPKGAFYCIAKLPVNNADNFAQWLLESFELNNETVMVAPAAGFYSTPNIGLSEVRIAYVLKKEALVKSCEILKAALIEIKPYLDF